jgi:hypothetical protein
MSDTHPMKLQAWSFLRLVFHHRDLVLCQKWKAQYPQIVDPFTVPTAFGREATGTVHQSLLAWFETHRKSRDPPLPRSESDILASQIWELWFEEWASRFPFEAIVRKMQANMDLGSQSPGDWTKDSQDTLQVAVEEEIFTAEGPLGKRHRRFVRHLVRDMCVSGVQFVKDAGGTEPSVCVRKSNESTIWVVHFLDFPLVRLPTRRWRTEELAVLPSAGVSIPLPQLRQAKPPLLLRSLHGPKLLHPQNQPCLPKMPVRPELPLLPKSPVCPTLPLPLKSPVRRKRTLLKSPVRCKWPLLLKSPVRRKWPLLPKSPLGCKRLLSPTSPSLPNVSIVFLGLGRLRPR